MQPSNSFCLKVLPLSHLSSDWLPIANRRLKELVGGAFSLTSNKTKNRKEVSETECLEPKL